MTRSRVAPSVPVRGTDAETRVRILHAALACFARGGYAATTVRQICREAGVNGAAANYHFGSKHNLYVDVLRRACRAERLNRPLEPYDAPAVDASEARVRLEETVRRLAQVLLAPGRNDAALVLLQEIRTPTDALDIVVSEFVRPRFETIRGVVAPFLDAACPRDVDLAALSVLGQIAYYRLASPVALRLLGERAWSRELVEDVVDHVARFSAGALRSLFA